MHHPSGLIAEFHDALRAGRISCRALIDACLANIHAHDQHGAQLNAVVAINAQAQARADALDAQWAATGRLAGPLHGVPVVVKDNFHTHDMPTRAGAQALSEACLPLESAATQALRDAGAIILAKTNLHELALAGLSVSSSNGQTRNPYDPARTPGGSSGGTGAALAAGYALAGLGTDTVNSIRSPASANGLVGLRPTRGLVSRAGIVPVAESQDVAGPLALCVADAARLLDALAGFDARDPVTALGVGHRPDAYAAALHHALPAPPRLGVLRALFGTEGENAAVNQVLDAAFARLTAQGMTLVEIDAPDIRADAILAGLDVQRWEFRTQFEAYLAQRRDPTIHSLADLIADGRYHPGLTPFFDQARDITQPDEDITYLQRLAGMARLRTRILALMAEHAVDALVYPLQQCLVVPIGAPDQKQRNGIVAAVTGLPAITLPAGLSAPDAQAPVGVPVGMDLLGRAFDEGHLLRIAGAIEACLPAVPAPPGMAPLSALWHR